MDRSLAVIRRLQTLRAQTLCHACRSFSEAAKKQPDRKILETILAERQSFKKGEICDSVTIYTRGGAGGSGLHSKNATGGKGGSVWLEAADLYQNLNHIHHHPNRRFIASRGDNGSFSSIRGRKGEDVVVEVPPGTLATDIRTGSVICDVDTQNKRYLLQEGAKGGSLINNYLGRRGEERYVKLVLKSIADVGLVGYPNAGKSSLLSMLSTATPAIGSYPFTTLKPTIGYMQTTDRTNVVAIADIPGLIEGASDNRGLGHVFLQHIERTRTLLFVLDIQGFRLNYKNPHRTPFETFGYLCRELELYMSGLTKRPTVVAVNKMDTDGSDAAFEEFVQLYKSKLSKLVKVHSIVPISCYTGQGLDELGDVLYEMKYKKKRKLTEADLV